MPNWGEHLLIANKLLKKIKVDENLFLFGNILPDVQDGYLVKGISNIIPHRISHYSLYDKYVSEKHKYGYENFYEKYKDKLDNPMIIGYLSHLMADYYWNNMFYEHKCIKENNEVVGYKKLNGDIIRKQKDELRKDKQKEFEIFHYYIYSNYDIKLPQYNENIVQNTNLIDVININNDDVKKVINYIEETKLNSKNQNQETQIFTKEELELHIDKTVEFIIDFIDKNQN